MPVKLLVVDDEPDLELLVRQRFRRQIRSGDYAFEFARNGVEALQKLQTLDDVDLVLTDINMPEMDGLTLLLKLKELNRVLKAVIVSAYGDMENIRIAMNRGAADFLTKPIDFQDMEITLRKTLEDLNALRQALREHDQLLAIRHELDVAASIQQSILPRRFPPFPGCTQVELHAAMLPAREVGGDFYDFFLIDDSHLGLVIADVSGKGMPAAIFMSMSRTLLKSTALQGLAPRECLRHVNSLLCLDNPMEMFVTVFYGVLDTHSGHLEFCNGGHNPPLCVRKNGHVEALPMTGGVVLGVLEDAQYGSMQAELSSGDMLFLYTDGITEAMDADGKLFTETRLRSYLAQAASGSGTSGSPSSVVDGVIDEIRRHSTGAAQSDDITALCVRRV